MPPIVVSVWLLLAVGCAVAPAPTCPQAQLPLTALVDDYNANAHKVPRLFARVKLRVDLTTFDGKSFGWGGVSPLDPSSATLLLLKNYPQFGQEQPESAPAESPTTAPATAASSPVSAPSTMPADVEDRFASPEQPPLPEVSFVIIAREAGAELFRLGSDSFAGLYYLWLHFGREGGAWYGRQTLAGAPGVAGLPINPLQLVEVLGVTELPPAPVPPFAKRISQLRKLKALYESAAGSPPSQTAIRNLALVDMELTQLEMAQEAQARRLELPAVVMKLDEQPCAYVVQYLDAQPVTGQPKIWREIFFRWSDTEKPRPFRVRLYDGAGRCRMIADLDRYAPIASDDSANAPVMPTDFRITWPVIRDVQPGGRLHMVLSEMSAQRPVNPKVFNFANSLPGGLAPVLVDRLYSPQGEGPGK